MCNSVAIQAEIVKQVNFLQEGIDFVSTSNSLTFGEALEQLAYKQVARKLLPLYEMAAEKLNEGDSAEDVRDHVVGVMEDYLVQAMLPASRPGDVLANSAFINAATWKLSILRSL